MNTVTIIDCVARSTMTGEETEIVFGVMPNGYDPEKDIDLSDLPFTQFVYYWLCPQEMKSFGVGFEIGEWEVVEVGETHEACVA